ncbi:conserved hypothetical protein [Luminiphilus syltensis NOR5-1B]|uniref:TesB-like acyl-CoA thioesterase 3 n=1 Tax=Luminiphilus syltensis NOR5-1B TaxID=565045 RepID=B8KW45_9GAMM|nr:thioesterase family protein [Luminiphilus syltensis]EED36874.1 conserved hypothetical protein [Luminiphilus syltensis NOR5-1B]
MGKFTRDTGVTAGANNEWHGELHSGWRVGEIPNGGYVLALIARALRQSLPHRDPLTINAFFLAPTRLGEVLVRTDSLREGRGTSFGSAELWQDEELKVRVTAAFTDLDRLSGEQWLGAAAPAVPDFDALKAQTARALEIHHSVEMRMVRGFDVFEQGKRPMTGEFIAWLQHCDAAPADTLDLIMMADIMPPPVFTVLGPFGWVPTIEITVQCRARPAPGPLLGRHLSRYLTRGIIEADGELWDSEGQLVALSRQTMKVRQPKTAAQNPFSV